MNSKQGLLGLVVLGAMAWANANTCEANVSANDSMQFNVREIVVPATCQNFTVHFKHSGKMPKTAMGHNFVVTKTSDLTEVIRDGMRAGMRQDFVKADDARVLAKTRMLGGGESQSVQLNVAKLKAAPHTYVCTFPGHSGVMRGKITVK